MRHPVLSLVLAAAASSPVLANPVFFAFQENTLHRVNADTSVDQFTLSSTMVSSAFNPQGRLIGMDGRTSSPPFSSYELSNPFGAAPSLTGISNSLVNRLASVTFVGDDAYGFNFDGNFVQVDPTTLNVITNFGSIGVDGANVALGYDGLSDTMYLVNRDTDSLYTVDYMNITSSLVGSLGVDFQNAGAEFYDGRLYLAGQNVDSGFFEIGEVDVLDGSYSTMFQLGGFTDPSVQTELVSLAVIPAPGAMALLGLGGLVVARRRR